jgi:hypothetical protein
MDTGTAMNNYEIKFTVKCPMDDDCVEYTLNLQTDKMVLVEDLVRATDIKPSGFHESIADGLFALFGGYQTITAVHQGVKIITTRGDAGLAEAIKQAFLKYGFSGWNKVAEIVREKL